MNTYNLRTISRGHRVIGNSLALILAQVATMVLGLMALPLILPMIGPVGYGIWVIISGFSGYFSVFDMGLGGTFVAQLARRLEDHDGLRQIITIGVLAYLTIGTLLLPVAWMVVSHLTRWFGVPHKLLPQVIPVFWLVYGALFFNLISNSIGALISAYQWMRWQAALRIGSQVVNYTVVLVALRGHQGLYAFAWGLWVSSGFVTTLSVWKVWPVLHGRLFYAPGRIPRSLVRALLSYGGWLQINNVANQIIYETDRILTGLYAGLLWVTMYQINYKLGNTVRRVPLSLMGALLPAVSQVTDRDTLRQAYVSASRYLALLSFLMSASLMVSLPLLMKAWMGRSYPHESLVFVLMVGAYTTSNLTGIGTTVLRGQLQPRLTSYYTAFTALLKLSISLALAPHYGLLGILVGSLIGSTFGTLYLFAHLFPRLNLGWGEGLWQWLPRLALASIPVAWAGYQWARGAASTEGRFTSGLLAAGTLIATPLLIVIFLRLVGFFTPRDWIRIAPSLPIGIRAPLAFLMGAPKRDATHS